jgi:hypothetical protein
MVIDPLPFRSQQHLEFQGTQTIAGQTDKGGDQEEQGIHLAKYIYDLAWTY